MFEDLENIFGIKIEERKFNPQKGLPIYMLSRRKFFEIILEEESFIAVFVSELNSFGVVSLKKQIDQYEDFFEKRVAFSFNGLTKVQRNSLVKHRVPFIALPTQIYIPFLGIMLSDSYKKEKIISTDKMMPATQSLYLYLLSKKDECVSKMDAATKLNLSRMSISRASEQLETMGLISQEKVGKNIYMKLRAYDKGAYELAVSSLMNPVKKTIVVKDSELLEGLPFAGETALSLYSMLSEPAIPAKAISKDSSIIERLKEVDEKWDSDFPCIRLELWKYDPLLFSNNGIVDRVSLAKSFEGVQDERIEEAIDICMKGLNDKGG